MMRAFTQLTEKTFQLIFIKAPQNYDKIPFSYLRCLCIYLKKITYDELSLDKAFTIRKQHKSASKKSKPIKEISKIIKEFHFSP